MWSLIRTFSWQELRHHPWRSASAVVAVMLGVALAFGVHLINASALAEFASAVASVNGQPDLRLKARQGTLDDHLLDQVMRSPAVSVASPVLELSVPASAMGDGARPQTLRLVGVDALSVAPVSPALLPRRSEGAEGAERGDRLDLFAPDAVFLNASARQLLGIDTEAGAQARLWLWRGAERLPVRVAGTVAAAGEPLAVMDVAALQDLMDRPGQLSRIDLRLQPGRQASRVQAELDLPAHVLAEVPEQSTERASNLSRAYRINLTVLALVALFTGAFLVFSVLSLSVARRQQQFALLGVLGLSARERLRLVLAESAALGLLGSMAGIALGTALAALALDRLGGDLGGGYFSGAAPAAAMEPGRCPALWGPGPGRRPGRRLVAGQRHRPHGPGAGPQGPGADRAGRAAPPPHRPGPDRPGRPAGLGPPGGWCAGGRLCVGRPAAGGRHRRAAAGRGRPARPAGALVATRALPLLAVERSRRLRETAAVATSGVVASLALSVALTVMVASFRDSVTRWLDGVLPAELYVRSTGGTVADSRHLPTAFIDAVQTLPGVQRVDTLRATPLQFDAARPPVTLLVRPLHGLGEMAQVLPLVGTLRPAPADSAGEVVRSTSARPWSTCTARSPGRPCPPWPACSRASSARVFMWPVSGATTAASTAAWPSTAPTSSA
jgi:putative ABC transport system permease protein